MSMLVAIQPHRLRSDFAAASQHERLGAVGDRRRLTRQESSGVDLVSHAIALTPPVSEHRDLPDLLYGRGILW